MREHIAKQVQHLLVEEDMTRRELADRLGKNPMVVYRRINGEVAWDVDDLEDIADVFGIDVADLLPAKTTTGRTNMGLASRTERVTPTRPVDRRPPAGPLPATRRPARITPALPASVRMAMLDDAA